MPHETIFVDSALQARVRILGLTLRPFSIGHQVLLIRQRNPLVWFDEREPSLFSPEAQRDAIQNAVLVCYRSWKENLLRERWIGLWRWRVRNMDHEEATRAFMEYHRAGSQCLPAPSDAVVKGLYGDDDGPGREYGSPFNARLLLFVMSLPPDEIRMFGESAYDFPLGLAQVLYLSHLESEGKARVENEREAMEEAENQRLKSETTPERRFK